MNIFTTRSKSEKLRKAFFSAFLIVSLVLSQAALPLTLAYAQTTEEGTPIVETQEQVAPSDEQITEEPMVAMMLPEEPVAKVIALKVVCDAEQYLPNWGAGGHAIDAGTASSWVNQSNGKCHQQPGWEFQWGDQNAPDAGPTLVGEAPGYTTFNSDGIELIPITGVTEIHLREVLQPGYVPFTGQNTTQDVSAEFYCNGDTLNYDNWDFIRNPEAGKIYHCVGFNAPIVPILQCNANATADIFSGASTQVDGHDAVPVATPYHSAWAASIPGATWIWSEASVVDATVDTTKTFTKTFSVLGTPMTSSLKIAADNNYDVYMNNAPVVGAGCSDVSGATFGGEQTCTIPANMMTNGTNTLSIKVKNWAVAGSDASSNPAGLLYKLTLNNNECVVPPPPAQTATVTMCKVDAQQAPLPGWTLMLKGASIGSVDVLPNGADFKIAGVPAGDYILKALGKYTYRGTAGAEFSDAAYSQRDPGDAVYQAATGDQTAFLPWVRENNFPSPNTGWLGVMYNNAFTNWGSIFNASHEYALGTTTASLGDMSFKILDDQYGDNSGKITVSAAHGYTGVTGQNGCVAFNNVPYGTYTADEIMKDGWENVSGLGSVVVDSPTESVTVVNQMIPTPLACTANQEYVANSSFETGVPAGSFINLPATDTTSISAWTVASGEVDYIGSYWNASQGSHSIDLNGLQAGSITQTFATNVGDTYTVTFDLSGNPEGYTEGPYVSPSAKVARVSATGAVSQDYTFDTMTEGNSLSNMKWQSKSYSFVATATSTTLTFASQIAGAFGPAIDNVKISCGTTPPGGPTTLKVHIYKYLKNGTTTAQLPNDSTAPAFPMTASWDATNIGAGSGSYVLGNYHGQGALKYAADTSPMTAPADYTTTETIGGIVVGTDAQSCPAGNYRFLGYKSGTSLALAEAAPLNPTAPVYTDITTDRFVIVVNEKCPDVLGETASSHTTTVKAADLAADYAAVAGDVTKWFFYNDENDTINNALGSFVTGPATAPAGTGSAQMTVTGTERKNIATYQFKNVKLSDIKNLSYSTYSQSAGDGALGLAERAAYLQFNIDFTNTDTWQNRIAYVPSINGAVVADSWQSWDALNSGNALWVYSGATWPTTVDAGTTPKTWAQILALYPNAETRSTDSWLGFRIGEPYNNGFTGNVDKFAIGIKTGINTHTETYDFEPTAVTPNGGGGSGGSGGGGGSAPLGKSAAGPATTGSVLGASTSCGIYLADFLKLGWKNSSEQVKKLQTFLNDYLKLKPALTVNGIFGIQTQKAVVRFQEQESDYILKPWVGLTLKDSKKGTGWVYKTTVTRINNIMCPELNLQNPPLTID